MNNDNMNCLPSVLYKICHQLVTKERVNIKMKTAVLFLTVLGWVAASPNGYYHQEYNYKTSSSAYKNNQLQHQTDDQGYYRKDGDLEGRTKPRVDANSEHSEYVNPDLKNGDYRTGLAGNANGDLSSYGHMRADIGSYGTRDLSSEGLAHGDHIAGAGGAYSGYSSGSYGSNSYGSSSHSYGMNSNLRSVTSHLQRELESELQRAIEENRAYAQSSVDVGQLESELRQNLTNRLNAELTNRYGQQSIRGGLSYTISGGRLHSTANYDNQELQDLRSQLENTLLNQLRTRYYQTGSSSQYERQTQGGYGYTTTRPVYYTHYPQIRPATTIRPSYTDDYNRNDYTRYTPVANPESLTTIATRVQNQLDTRLNELLEEVQSRYFSSSSSYSLTNIDVVLENLRNELRNNVTYLLNEQIKLNYGNQIPRDGHMYSVGPNGQTANQYNYAISDLENLRTQIERNLIDKLKNDFERYKSRWHQTSSSSHQSSQSGYNVKGVRYGSHTSQYDTYTTPRYEVYSTPQYTGYNSDVEHFSTRPSSSHIAPLITSGSTNTGNRRYNLIAGAHQSGYEINGASGSSISQLQSQLQQDLSRQLEAAISRGHYGSYSSSNAYNHQPYQLSLQQLTDELNRNLTRQLQEYSASGSYGAYGNFDQAEMSRLRNQLQTDLMRQLQQGLQQSYQSSSSFSASSSSSSSGSNYRPIRGFNNYQMGQYRSGGGIQTFEGEDCAGDDPNAYNSHRIKRSYQPYRSQPLGLSYNGGYNSRYSGGNSGSNYENIPSHRVEQLGQVDDSDLTQQVQDASFEKLQNGLNQQQLGQQVDDSDLTQQVEGVTYEKLQNGLNQRPLGQQIDDSDLTQQVENSYIGKLQLGSQNQQVVSGQTIDDSDQTQQVEDSGFSRLQLSSQSQQQVDNSDLTQQVEDSGLGRLQLNPQNQQQVDNSDLTQQVEDSGLGRLQLNPQNQQQSYKDDKLGNLELSQQVEPLGLGKLQLGSQGQQQIQLGQQIDNSDLTQQVEDINLENSGNYLQSGKQVDDIDLTQQQQDNIRLGLQFTSQSQKPNSHHIQNTELGQQEDNSDLTQQTEDASFPSGIQSQPLHNPTPNLNSQQRQNRLEFGQQQDNSDLTQQVDNSFLQGSQLGSLQSQVNLNTPQRPQRIQFGQQDNFHGTQQADNSFLHGSQSGALENQNNLNIQQKPSLQPPVSQDNSDLTSQTEIPSESLISQNQNEQRGDQKSEDLDRFTSQQQHTNSDQQEQISANWPTYDINFGSNLDREQKQLARQLETDLSKQLKDAVRTYYSISYTSSQNYQSAYRDLLRELERNLTKQLETPGNSRYSYYYVFNGQQRNLLQKELENQLKVQLQNEISSSQNVNRELTDSSTSFQEQNSFGNTEFGHQTGTREKPLDDLTQQVQSPQFSDQSNSGGKLQLGTQIVQEPINNFNANPGGSTPQVTTPSNQVNQPNRYLYRPYSNIQFGNKPINRRPPDSNSFLQTEIAQQKNLYPNQDITNQQNIPDNEQNFLVLDVTKKPQGTSEIDELNTASQSQTELETPKDDLIQKQIDFADIQQQQNNDFSSLNPSLTPSVNQVSESNQIGINSQTQSRAEAERESNLLINTVREAQQPNRNSQIGSNTYKPRSYSQIVRQENYGSVDDGYQTESQYSQQSQNQEHNSFQVFLNNKQTQLAQELEEDLSKQLKDAVSQNYYTVIYTSGTLNPQQYQIKYDELLKELEKNITKELETSFNQGGRYSSSSSYSSYTHGSLTPIQRQQLIEKLQSDLSKQLQQQLQISYGLQGNTGNSYSSSITYTSPQHTSSYGASSGLYNNYERNYDTADTTNQLNYGQQENVPDTEVVSPLKPLEPQQATVVENVEPRVPVNPGVKGRRRYQLRINTTPVSQVEEFAPVYAGQQPQVPDQANVETVTPEISNLEPVPEENLLWWKRFGNKVKQSATSLKEKIVG